MLWCLGGLLLLLGTLVAAVHLPVVQDQLLDQLVKHVQASTHLRIEYQSYSWRPFSMLRLKGLTVHSPTKELLHCQEAQLAYHLSWHPPFLIPTELTLQQPLLYLQKDAQGRWIFPFTMKGGGGGGHSRSKPSRRWSHFPCPNLKIVSGRVVGFQQSRQILTIQDLNATLPLQMISSSEGPCLKIDLDPWMGLTSAP